MSKKSRRQPRPRGKGRDPIGDEIRTCIKTAAKVVGAEVDKVRAPVWVAVHWLSDGDVWFDAHTADGMLPEAQVCLEVMEREIEPALSVRLEEVCTAPNCVFHLVAAVAWPSVGALN